MRLENWGLCCGQALRNPYMAPELQKIYLCGTVYGHPNHQDGKFITTSRVIAVRKKGHRETMVDTRSGSVYVLGTVDPEYEKLFPNALQRVQNMEKP